MAMSTEETFLFLELYQAEKCLWNPKNKDYKNINIINNAWKRIADTMGVPCFELKKKKESLMTCFWTNFKKKLSSLKSETGKDYAYKPIWLFYDAMEVFLKDVYECKSILNSEVNTNGEEHMGIDELEGSNTTGVQTSDVRSDIFQTSSKNNNTVTDAKVAKTRRANNPPELQEASKHMSTALSTLNKILQTNKNREDKEDDSDLFCKLLASQLRDFPKHEKEEIMCDIHRLIRNKRRRPRRSLTIPYNWTSPEQSSWYSNGSPPSNNMFSPDSPIDQKPSLQSCRSNISKLSHDFNETSHHASSVDQQPTLYLNDLRCTPNNKRTLSRDPLQTETNNILIEIVKMEQE